MISHILTLIAFLALYTSIYAGFSSLIAFGLRHLERYPFFQRLNDANWRVLTLIDENAAFLIFVPLYVFGLYPRQPLVGDTISSLAWAGDLTGVRWCVPLRSAIDALFRILTSQERHCEKAHAKWANPLGGQ